MNQTELGEVQRAIAFLQEYSAAAAEDRNRWDEASPEERLQILNGYRRNRGLHPRGHLFYKSPLHGKYGAGKGQKSRQMKGLAEDRKQKKKEKVVDFLDHLREKRNKSKI